MSEWVLSGFGPGPSRLRFTGVYREAMHAQHLNSATRCRPNDLTDLLYLSCAATYADVVAYDEHMVEILRQAGARLRRRVGAQEAPRRRLGRRGAAACEVSRGRRGGPTALRFHKERLDTASGPCPGRRGPTSPLDDPRMTQDPGGPHTKPCQQPLLLAASSADGFG